MATNHKLAFVNIRNFLVGRTLGATRDQSLLEETMKCLFSYKKYHNKMRRVSGDPLRLAAIYRDGIKGERFSFAENRQLLLDPASIKYIHENFENIDLFNADRDPIGDLYETFIGSSIRGSEGQFFTPLNAVEWLTSAVGLSEGESVIDPACGAGAFLMAAGRSGPKLKLFGIEKDAYLASLAQARLQVLGYDSRVECGNSLTLRYNGAGSFRDLIGTFDVVLANPPFGKNIRSVDTSEQADFDLGHKWVKGETEFEKTSTLLSSVPPQVLFIERIISLLRAGGRAAIVVPESLLCGKSYAPVMQYIRTRASVQAVVGMPEALFKHSGKGGTHTKTCLLVFTKGGRALKTYMAEAAWCGHDSRGRTIDRDDLPALNKEFASFRQSGSSSDLRLGYIVNSKALSNNILAPRYYEPTAQKVAGHLARTHELVSVAELVSHEEISISSGNEVGKLSYGGGSVPFVRTSDLSGWEIKVDPKHLVSEETYNKHKTLQDVRAGDVLMVRDGTYLIGTCAYVTRHDERIVYQSHILKFRCSEKSRITPFVLLAVLSSEPVQQQIKSKTFTQDIINSLGNRIGEIILPIPRSAAVRDEIDRVVRKVIEDRIEARELSRVARRSVVDPHFLIRDSTRQARSISLSI